MNSPLIPSSVDVLLFDLGRVVLDINFDSVMVNWAGHAGCEPADLTARFVVNDSFRHHETGQIDDAAFFQALRQSLGIGISDVQFLEGWNAIFSGEMPGIAPLLSRAAARMPLYAFSNTNPAHVAHFSKTYADLLGHFAADSFHAAKFAALRHQYSLRALEDLEQFTQSHRADGRQHVKHDASFCGGHVVEELAAVSSCL